MNVIWTAGRAVGDALLAPCGLLPPLWGLVLLSLVMGVALLGLFRVLTPQRRLRGVKHQMSATLYEMRIYSARPLIVLAAQGRALKLTAIYLLLALPSLLVLAPLVTALASRAALRYELRPLKPGEVALVHFSLQSQSPPGRPLVTSGAGLRVLPPLVMVRHEQGARRGHLRLRARTAGTHKLTIRVGSQLVHKTVQVGGADPVSWHRAVARSPSALLSREPALPAGGAVEQIVVDYPRRDPPWPGCPWWVHLLAISMAAAFALRRRLGVVF